MVWMAAKVRESWIPEISIGAPPESSVTQPMLSDFFEDAFPSRPPLRAPVV
jgi:hypothetical protein